MKDTQYYIDIFKELMDLYEFRVHIDTNEDGEEILKLVDLQGGNLGDIESEEFNDFYEILERMEAYHNDYIIEALAECVDYYCPNEQREWATWEELMEIVKDNFEELMECAWDIKVLELILNPHYLKGIKGEIE